MTDKFKKLRDAMKKQNVDGFLVPRTDEFQSEYVAPYAERLAWLTGFTGSAGMAVILRDKAALFVDGRYVLQAKAQVDRKLFEVVFIEDQKPLDWVKKHLKKSKVVGYDPHLHTMNFVDQWRQILDKNGLFFQHMEHNPIDQIWKDQPVRPTAPVMVHDVQYAGVSSADKRKKIAADLKKNGVGAAVITAADSVAWLLNIRGADIAYNPVVLVVAVVHEDASVDLFVDQKKIAKNVKTHLGKNVRICDPESLKSFLQNMREQNILVDPKSCSAWVRRQLRRGGALLINGDDPCVLPKACKNKVEMDGARAAHVRDGAAVVKFLHWLDGQKSVNEIGASDQLYAFRAGHKMFRDLSFDTISGAGPNGAIVHYRSTEKTNRALKKGELYLVDSGAQYPDGTTDITRTVAIGKPTAEYIHRYTLVLKGHVAIARAKFPKGTSGSQLDGLARQFLWQEGLDYAHGTGHGVGSFLCVHEGPHRISKGAGDVALQAGMIVSNEPGYYKDGAYGIRIENLVLVQAEKNGFLGFETLTMAPFDRRLIDVKMLTPDELVWINQYHAQVRKKIVPLVSKDVGKWLQAATSPL